MAEVAKERRETRIHISILVAALVPRLTAAYLRPPDDPDWGHYWRLSSGLIRYGVLGYDVPAPSTTYEPLYPLFLAGCRWLLADRLFLVLSAQAVVAAIGAVFLYELTLRLTADRRTAGLAAVLYAFYPYYISQAATLTEVSFLTTLLIVTAYSYCVAETTSRAIACGIAFGLALLTRLAAAPILVLAAIARLRNRERALAMTIAGVASSVYLPFAVRNHTIDGSVLPTRGGYDLFKGNCKYSDEIIPAYNVDVLDPYLGALLVSEMPAWATASERERDRFYFRHAVQFMRDHPGRTVALSLRKAALFFCPRLVPFHPVGKQTFVRFGGEEEVTVVNAVTRGLWEEAAYSLTYAPLVALGLVGAYRRRRLAFRADFILHAVVISFLGVYSIYWTATRVRAPVDFVWMFFAACALRGRIAPRAMAAQHER